jgi:hypothetical protein
MTGAQLPLDVCDGLPIAFVDRWRELGGPSIAGEVCVFVDGRWTFTVNIASHGQHAFLSRTNPAACADELARRIAKQRAA